MTPGPKQMAKMSKVNQVGLQATGPLKGQSLFSLQYNDFEYQFIVYGTLPML